MAMFKPFGGDHWAALAIIAVTAACLAWGVRRQFVREHAATILAGFVPGAMVLLMLLDARAGVSWRSYAPLQLCDAAAILLPIALVRRSQLAFELCFLWGGAGTLPALLTPDIAEGFPHWRFVLYFAQHGGIVVAAAFLVATGMRPRPRAPWFALLLLNGYAAIVALVDFAGRANFMYLRHKPGAATPLDLLGPWPWYIAACELVALASFWLLMGVARLLPRPSDAAEI
jgi:hypothetical integral membrane protein (TIGR02206 family)